MKLFLQFLKKESTEFRGPLLAAVIASGIINGIGIVVAVKAMGQVKAGQLNASSFIIFMVCIVGFWISKEHALNRTTHILEEVIDRLRMRILHKIRETDLLPFEGMDKGRIYSCLSSDAVGISTSAGMVINASSSLVMLVFTYCLIATISLKALVMTVSLIGIVIAYYLRYSRHVNEQLACATVKENEFFENLHGLLNGFKELKLSRSKRDDFFTNDIEEVVHSTKSHRVSAGKALNHSLLLAHTYLFFTLAGLIFVLPVLFPAEASIIPKLIPIILFSAGPLGDVVSSIPALSKAEASIINIYGLEEGIDKRIEESSKVEGCGLYIAPPADFVSLSCEGLSFQYPNGGLHPFKVQPTTFEIKAGQIVFIVGGNGSGKSTFLKMITGLYKPNAGRILLNGEEINESNITMLQGMFSPIFTDFFLFKRVLGKQKVDAKRVTELLVRMELADKTSIVDGRVTNLNLSTGQRKRLALILSTLDDRPIYLFDEWAADQDPIFRKYFYEVLLRKMATEGKTILAVTHDDHYFHVADKVYMMEYGNFVPYQPIVQQKT